MDREELNAIIAEGPVRIHMNDGQSYLVPGPEFALVSDITATILYRAKDGKYRHMHLPLVTMSGVEPLKNNQNGESSES